MDSNWRGITTRVPGLFRNAQFRSSAGIFIDRRSTFIFQRSFSTFTRKCGAESRVHLDYLLPNAPHNLHLQEADPTGFLT